MPKSPNLIKVRENGLDWLFNVHWDWCERVETKGVPKWYANELIEVLMTKVEAEAEGPRSSKILGSDESQLGFRTRRGKEERSAARARALEKLKGYLDKPCRMDWTDVPSIAAQVALRVREPKLIFQGKSDTCAPNMILINLAKRSPEKYVGLVMDLVTTGKSRLENLELQMPGPVINGAEECQRCGMPAADYAVLGSIGRPSVLPILGCFSPMDTDRFYKGTEPEQIVELLVKLGYTSITKYNAQNWKLDPRFEDPGEYKRCLTALADATLSANRFVILMTSVNFADYFKKAYIEETVQKDKLPRKAGFSLGGERLTKIDSVKESSPGHAVLLDKFSYDETLKVVTLKIYTYSASIRRQIDLEAFKYYLRGYIVATLT